MSYKCSIFRTLPRFGCTVLKEGKFRLVDAQYDIKATATTRHRHPGPLIKSFVRSILKTNQESFERMTFLPNISRAVLHSRDERPYFWAYLKTFTPELNLTTIFYFVFAILEIIACSGHVNIITVVNKISKFIRRTAEQIEPITPRERDLMGCFGQTSYLLLL